MHGVQVSDLELASLDKLLLTAGAQQKDRPGTHHCAAHEHHRCAKHHKVTLAAPTSTMSSGSSMAATWQAASLAQPDTVGWSSASCDPSNCQAIDHVQRQHVTTLMSTKQVSSNGGSAAEERSDQPQSTRQDASQHVCHQREHRLGTGAAVTAEAGLGPIAVQLWSATAGLPGASVGFSAQQQQQQQQGIEMANIPGSEVSAEKALYCGDAGQPAQPDRLSDSLQQQAVGLNLPSQQLDTHPSAGSLHVAPGPTASCIEHVGSSPASSLPQAIVNHSSAEQPGHSSVAGSRAVQKGPRAGTGRQHARKQHSGRRIPASMDASRPQPPRQPEMPFLRFTVSCAPDFKPVLHPSKVA